MLPTLHADKAAIMPPRIDIFFIGNSR
jgi:hypothetical protein